jgi:hypothetical protein
MSVPTISGAFSPIATSGPVLAPGRSGQAPRSAATATQSGQGEAPGRERRDKPRQWLIVLTVVAAVIVLDQSIKWWAWRHIYGARINSGGDVLVGPTIGAWYADPVTGALLDPRWRGPLQRRGLVHYGAVRTAPAHVSAQGIGLRARPGLRNEA